MKKNSPIQFEGYTELKKKTVHGLSLLVVREFFLKAIAVAGQIVLARILAPDIFGVFAILSFLVGLAELFTDIGLSQAIIQSHTQMDRETLSSIFFVKQVLSLLAVALLFVLCFFMSHLYPSLMPEHLLMLKIMALTLLAKPLRTILISLLERELRYVAIPTVDIAGMVVYYLVALSFVLAGFSLWGLVIAILVKEVVELAVLLYFQRWLPQIQFTFSKVRSFIHFGAYLQLATFVGVIHNSMIPLIAGTQLTPAAVGFLDWGDKIVSIPRAVTDNIGRISFSSFSRIQNNTELLSRACEKTLSLTSIMTLYLVTIILPFGWELVHFVLTDKWLPAVPPLYWFIGSVVFIGGVSILQQGIIALGKTKEILAISTTIILLQVLTAFFLARHVGMIGIAISTFFGFALLFFAYVWFGDHIGIHVRIGKMFFGKCAIACLSLLLAVWLNSVFQMSLVTLMFKISIVSVVYALFIYLYEQEDVRIIFSLLSNS